ncbi:hypothetical protein GCM10027612_31670 [Microbispora bryophytorum subsp. camponoti]
MRAVGARTPKSPWRVPRPTGAQTYQSDGNDMSELSVSTGMTALRGYGVACPNARYHRTPERPDDNGRSPRTPCE